jgi:hypothetical protein
VRGGWLTSQQVQELDDSLHASSHLLKHNEGLFQDFRADTPNSSITTCALPDRLVSVSPWLATARPRDVKGVFQDQSGGIVSG